MLKFIFSGSSHLASLFGFNFYLDETPPLNEDFDSPEVRRAYDDQFYGDFPKDTSGYQRDFYAQIGESQFFSKRL